MTGDIFSILSPLLIALIPSIISCVISSCVYWKTSKIQMRLNQGLYISNAQFDYEFKTYSELSGAAFECGVAAGALFPEEGMDLSILGKDELKIMMLRGLYINATDKAANLSHIINRSWAFVDPHIVQLYLEFLLMCRKQIDRFDEIYLANSDSDRGESIQYIEGTRDLQKKFREISDELRVYLSDLHKIRIGM